MTPTNERQFTSDTQTIPAQGNNVTLKLVSIVAGTVIVCIAAYGWINAELSGKADRTEVQKVCDKQDALDNEIRKELTELKINMAKVMQKLGVENK